ncbi:MAG: thioredoxin domain-containing protein [Cyclobacteriaceae bacterium]
MAKLNLLIITILIAGAWNCGGSKQISSADTEQRTANHLVEETSPYLLQHAYNPVDWYPWGDPALTKAKDENKLMVISIGYAACHWCHVMEHESFSDSTVAAAMNADYVSIKIDREERPDIDKIYMDAAFLISGRGGWPLNVIALPDSRPIYAGTYFPQDDWLSVLEHFSKLYREDPDKLNEVAGQLTQGIQSLEKISLSEAPFDFGKIQIDSVFNGVMAQVDFSKGGRLGPMKFPSPSIWDFLLKYNYHNQDEKSLEAVKVTLDHMARGGIYDHLGGGFARYSTDSEWRVPHFEKMLYDNAQLVSLYAEAYQLTKEPLYKNIVTHTLDFVAKEMTNNEGGFYSSYDADSEGEEGKYYVWSKEEIEEALGVDADLFIQYYQVTKSGNWEADKNILMPKKNIRDLVEQAQITEAEFHKKIADNRAKLLTIRAKRVPPGLDDKVLTSWNALMIKGYLDAYRVLDDEQYLDAALRNAALIETKILDQEGRLMRSYKDGTAKVNGFLDDYSFTIDAYIALYQSTFDEKWLFQARKMTDYVITHFYDATSGMFFYTSDLDPSLITRKTELGDDVIPSSNSAMAKNLFYLGTYFYQEQYHTLAKQMISSIWPNMKEQGPYYTNWAVLLQQMIQPFYEVAIVGERADQIRSEMDQKFLPNLLYMGGRSEGSLELLKLKSVEGKTMIYVCQDKVCQLPVEASARALEQIRH